MKKNSVARIIFYSVSAVLMITLLTTTLIGHSYRGIRSLFDYFSDRHNFTNRYDYSDDKSYSAGSTSLSDDIEYITVDWLSGSVSVEPYDGNEIIISETNQLDEENKMAYKVENKKLEIKFRKSYNTFFWNDNILKKNLEIKLPKNIAEKLVDVELFSTSANISIKNIAYSGECDINTTSGDCTAENCSFNSASVNTVSGNINIYGLSADKLNTAVTSGQIKMDNIKANTLNLNSVSGDIDMQGSANRIEANTVSGNTNLYLNSIVKKIDMDTVSGDTTVSVPEGNGFTAETETVSGSFNCDFPTNSSDGEYIYSSGEAEFEFSSISGNVYIKNSNSGITANKTAETITKAKSYSIVF